MHGLDMTGPGSSERAAARGEASGSSAFSGYSVVPVLAIVGVALLGEVCRPVTVLLVAGAAVLVTCVSLAFLLWAERNVTLFVSAVALVATAGVGAFALQFTEVQAAVNGIARPEPTRVAGPLDRPDATLAQRELRGQVLKGANLAPISRGPISPRPGSKARICRTCTPREPDSWGATFEVQIFDAPCSPGPTSAAPIYGTSASGTWYSSGAGSSTRRPTDPTGAARRFLRRPNR